MEAKNGSAIKIRGDKLLPIKIKGEICDKDVLIEMLEK